MPQCWHKYFYLGVSVVFGCLRAQQISSIIFKCRVLYHTEIDFLWLFIHLRLKGTTIWTGIVGPVMSLSVVFIDLYMICQKNSHRFLLTFFSVTEDIVLIEIMKKWGSPHSFKRKGALILLSSLVWGKSLTLCTRMCLYARANDAKIVRSRDLCTMQYQGMTLNGNDFVF